MLFATNSWKQRKDNQCLARYRWCFLSVYHDIVTCTQKKQQQQKKPQKKALKKYNKTRKYSSGHQHPLCRCEVLQIIKLIDCLKDLTASKKQTKQKNAEIKLDHRTRNGFIQSPNLRSLTSRIVHVYRTGLLAAIMNLVSNS